MSIAGGTHSYYNLAGIGFVSGLPTNSIGTVRNLAYSGSGVATISLQNGSFAPGSGNNLSPMTSTGANPTIVDIAANAAWFYNTLGITDYVRGLTGSGYYACTNSNSVKTLDFMPGAGEVYNFAGTTFNVNPGAAINCSLTMNGSPTGTEILSGKWAAKNGNTGTQTFLTVSSGNLVLANPSGNAVVNAVTVNGGNLYVSNTSGYALNQAINVTAGDLSDDTTYYNNNSYLSGSVLGASVSGLVTISSGGTLTAAQWRHADAGDRRGRRTETQFRCIDAIRSAQQQRHNISVAAHQHHRRKSYSKLRCHCHALFARHHVQHDRDRNLPPAPIHQRANGSTVG